MELIDLTKSDDEVRANTPKHVRISAIEQPRPKSGEVVELSDDDDENDKHLPCQSSPSIHARVPNRVIHFNRARRSRMTARMSVPGAGQRQTSANHSASKSAQQLAPGSAAVAPQPDTSAEVDDLQPAATAATASQPLSFPKASARLTQQRCAEQQARDLQAITKHQATRSQHHPPSADTEDGAHPAGAGAAKHAQHPGSYLRGVHASWQAAKPLQTAGQATQRTAQSILQPVLAQSLPPKEQLVRQVSQKQPAAQTPAYSRLASGMS